MTSKISFRVKYPRPPPPLPPSALPASSTKIQTNQQQTLQNRQYFMRIVKVILEKTTENEDLRILFIINN